jgi:hypothetical protein
VGDQASESGARRDDESARWLVINGRRWRRTDPALPDDLVAQLQSHLGRGRSGVRTAKAHGDTSAVAASRRRVGLAKLGLGERGPHWWEQPEAARIEQAQDALRELTGLDDADGDGGESADPA